MCLTSYKWSLICHQFVDCSGDIRNNYAPQERLLLRSSSLVGDIGNTEAILMIELNVANPLCKFVYHENCLLFHLFNIRWRWGKLLKVPGNSQFNTLATNCPPCCDALTDPILMLSLRITVFLLIIQVAFCLSSVWIYRVITLVLLELSAEFIMYWWCALWMMLTEKVVFWHLVNAG